MSGRRRSAAERALLHRRLAGAGVAGVAAVFAVAPLAQAAPSGTDNGASQTDDTTAKSGPTVKADAVAPDYGWQKVRVGVQVKDGSWVPDGTTTAGSEVTLTDTDTVNGGTPQTSTCTTDASTATPGSSATYCTFQLGLAARRSIKADGVPLDQVYILAPGHKLTLTQKSTKSTFLLVDTVQQEVDPCLSPPPVLNVRKPAAGAPTCSTEAVTRLFNDPGLPPKARNDAEAVEPGRTVQIDILGNDTTEGAPATVKVVTPPEHGTAKVITVPATNARALKAAAHPAIVYTPDAGFFGRDSLQYTLTTPNGTSTATVALRVAAPPTATDDSATTDAGTAVTVDVLANDATNGGGALTLDSVGDPDNGTARIVDGAVVYTPAADFTGTDSFTYVVENSLGSDTATVTVTVNGVANTGTQTQSLLLWASLLIASGGAATVAGRRRYHARHAGGA